MDRLRFERSEEEWAAVRERLRETLGADGTVTFVAEDAGDLVGELLAVPRAPGIAGIGVSVAARSRRQGVATVLFSAVLAWAEENDLDQLQLEVQEVNAPARALYEKHGFVDTGRRRQGERGPVLIMARTL